MGAFRVVLIALFLLAPVASVALAAPEPRAPVADALRERFEAGAARAPAYVVLAAPEGDPAGAFRDAGPFDVRHAFTSGEPAFAADLTLGQVEALARDGRVVAIALDEEVHATMGTAVAAAGVEAARADFGVDGAGATVCVIDTGVDASHADLDGGKVVGWRDFVASNPNPYDDNGHGTHVAGIVAGAGDGDARYRGVAPGATIVGVKVLNSAGSGSLSTVRAGVDWCVDQRAALGIDVISMSLGTSSSSDGQDALSLAVNQAADAGLAVVVAAGNSGPAKRTIGSPGAAAKAITVAAMADTGELGWSLAGFSSRGPTADNRVKPDVAAPGVAITAPRANSGAGYVAYSGTSMATPFVSGVIALLVAAGATPAAAGDAVLRTAEDWGATGHDVDYGRGLVRAYDALRDVAGGGGAGPAFPGHRREAGSMSGTNAQVFLPLFVTETSAPLSLTLLTDFASGGFPDFDLYLYAPGADTSKRANAVASGTSSARQDNARVQPTATGLWWAEIHSYSGSGPWYLDASGHLDLAPPATTLSLAGVAGEAGWYRGAVTATLAATDAASGVDATRYRLDAGAESGYSAPFEIAPDGDHALRYWSVDRARNVENANVASVRIDATPPASTATPSGTAGNAGWWRGPVAVSLAATDATSGVATLLASADGAPERETARVDLAGDGSHAVAYRARDVAGNAETARTISVAIDATPPVTTLALDGPAGANGWYRGAVAAALAATDATSGVSTTRAGVDGAPATDVTGPLAIATDGTHGLAYWSLDVAGNAEEPRSAAIRVDATPPTTTVALDGPAGNAGWWRGAVSVALAASDATSGVDVTYAALDGGAETVPAGPFAIPHEGSHVLSYRSRDLAGNAETAREVDVRIDATPPSTTHAVVGPAGAEGWFTGPVTLELDATDAVSGVADTRVSLDGAPSEAAGASYPFGGDGERALAYHSIDVAGNAESPVEILVRIDATPPTAAASLGEPRFDGARTFVTSATPVTLAGFDATSGVAALAWRVDGGNWSVYEAPFALPGPSGARVLEYFATDRAGNEGPIGRLDVFVDDTAPLVTITKPAPGSVWLPQASVGPFAATAPLASEAIAVQGARVSVHANATDPLDGGDASGVASMRVLVDGAEIARCAASRCETTWDTAGAAPGEHVVRVESADRLGNVGASEARVIVLGAALPSAA